MNQYEIFFLAIRVAATLETWYANPLSEPYGVHGCRA